MLSDSPSFQTEAKNLPPGWDVKYDTNTGKCYYVNYLTKAMSLEDPRIRLRQVQQQPSERTHIEAIPMQPLHGSPYHVYPTNNLPAVQAFQGPSAAPSYLPQYQPIPPQQQYHHPAPTHYQYTASPKLGTKFQQHLEMTALSRQTGSPHMPRIMSQLAMPQPQPSHQQHPLSAMGAANTSHQQQQETSFITSADTDTAVAKINTMFPTANDAHIRLLLKKYHNREAVVISALQVEKHPLTMPGPYATPPPPGRHATLLAAAANAFGISASTTTMQTTMMMTPPMGNRFAGIVAEAVSRTGSPVPGRPGSSCASVGTAASIAPFGSPRVGEAYRSSPKPHSSPKMKLRYLKSIFPKADEMLLLDLLANADNNVQHASEKLLTMGYEKRDTTAPKLTNRNREEQVMRERQMAESTPPPQPKVRTNEEKAKIRIQLQSQHPDIPGRIIAMALESVDYSEDRACQILKIVMQDDGKAGGQADKDIIDESSSSATSTINQTASNSGYSSTAPTTGSATISEDTTQPLSGGPSTSAIPSLESLQITSPINTAKTAAIPTVPAKAATAAPFTPSPDYEDDDDYTESSSIKHLSAAASTRKSNRSRAKTGAHNEEVDAARPINMAANAMVTSNTTNTVASATSRSSSGEFQSVCARGQACGPNASLRQGPDEDLLLSDYIAWNGANPEMNVSHQSLARGPDPSIRSLSTRATTTGPNGDLRKGAKSGLAKGSMYAHISRQLTNVKCN